MFVCVYDCVTCLGKVDSTYLRLLRNVCVYIWKLSGPLGLAGVQSKESFSKAQVWTKLIAIMINFFCPGIWTIETIKHVLSLLLNPQDILCPAYFSIKTLSLHINEWHLSARIVVRSVAKQQRLAIFLSMAMLNEELLLRC